MLWMQKFARCGSRPYFGNRQQSDPAVGSLRGLVMERNPHLTHPSEFTRWLTRLRAPLLAALFLSLGSCGRTEPLSEPDTVDDGSVSGESDSPSLAIAYAGGIPFGLFALPTSLFGSNYNGAVRNARILVETSDLRTELAAIKSRGARYSFSSRALLRAKALNRSFKTCRS